jgi:hypothetical protein
MVSPTPARGGVTALTPERYSAAASPIHEEGAHGGNMVSPVLSRGAQI